MFLMRQAKIMTVEAHDAEMAAVLAKREREAKRQAHIREYYKQYRKRWRAPVPVKRAA